MDFIPLILLFIILLLTIFFIKRWLTRRGEPPGPIGLPILGSYFQLEPRGYLAFCRMRKQYGDVFSLRVGSARYVVLTSYKSIKEALLDKSDNFAGRSENKFIQESVKRGGIVNIDGPLWQEHRRFSLQTLRDFGFGRNTSSEIILSEWDNLRHQLDQMVNTPVNTNDLLTRTVSNVICTMMFGEQPGYDPHDKFGEIMNKVKQNVSSIPTMKVPFMMFPQMHHLSPLIKALPMVKKLLNNLQNAQDYVRGKIEYHRKTLDSEDEPRDFTDVYLSEQMKTTKKTNTFTDWQLTSTILELFGAGTDTTANSLTWAILWMSMKPDLQRKVQQEIDDNIDASQSISYNDRQKLNLVQAVLDEVQRWASIVPYSLIHRNFQDDILHGYNIPANSNIIPCLYAAHHDPDVWEKPEDFYPQHFLTDDGQYKSRNELITFSLGRRSCLGESLARMEYFLFFTSIIRRYRVSLDAAVSEKKNLDEILLGSDGIIRTAGFHKINFKIRE